MPMMPRFGLTEGGRWVKSLQLSSVDRLSSLSACRREIGIIFPLCDEGDDE